MPLAFVIGAIKNADGDPLYTEFPGVGHDIWEQVKNTSGLLDWLFEEERDRRLITISSGGVLVCM